MFSWINLRIAVPKCMMIEMAEVFGLTGTGKPYVNNSVPSGRSMNALYFRHHSMGHCARTISSSAGTH